MTVNEESSVHSIDGEEENKIESVQSEEKAVSTENVEKAIEPQSAPEAEAKANDDLEAVPAVQTVEKPQRARKVKASWNVAKTKTVLAPQSRRKRLSVTNVHSGYKYKGSGFSVYKGKPIYSVTTLFCRKTFGSDEQKVRAFLVKSGGFSAKKIGSIEFKNGHFDSYCLIKVRGPKKWIQQRLDALNNEGRVVHIFERRQDVSLRKESSSLFVQNFDILNKSSHQRMTRLFLAFGELRKDIEIRTDKNRNPFAVVQFKYLSEAVSCYQASKMHRNGHFVFDGKVLDVSFSKF